MNPSINGYLLTWGISFTVKRNIRVDVYPVDVMSFMESALRNPVSWLVIVLSFLLPVLNQIKLIKWCKYDPLYDTVLWHAHTPSASIWTCNMYPTIMTMDFSWLNLEMNENMALDVYSGPPIAATMIRETGSMIHFIYKKKRYMGSHLVYIWSSCLCPCWCSWISRFHVESSKAN